MNFIYKWKVILPMLICCLSMQFAWGSSHREAPLIADDPLADNVDVYAFKSPDNPNMITLIATYVPLQLPHGGPNYYSFGENIRYEIHVDNDPSISGDEVTYRFTFHIVNEDPTTFFNIRLGAQNQKTTYTLERSLDGGATFQTILTDGIVPPNNIGTRSIESAVGLNSTYAALWNSGIMTTMTGENVFAGPVDDPFFVDLGGIFDLGDAARQDGSARDGLACFNVSAIAIQVPISILKKAGSAEVPTSILDPDYVIGVWASASRPKVRTLSSSADPSYMGDWVQVSRLGMPLTNEAVIPIGAKDFWNSLTPYEELAEMTMDDYFYNPELALYMDDALFGGAVPSFSALRVQRNSLQSFDFGNGQDGLHSLKGTPAVAGTALDDAIFGTLLLPGPGLPRSVDLWPIFHTGVPNLEPYQLATGKMGNPLATGKPFINNFLPNGGDMLRLNMAVPATPRDDANFSSEGLIQAAVLGLVDPTYNTTTDLEFIPNMDGFPNGRRLEDDVTRIELQAVGGAVLAAIGLWYDDYTAGDPNPVTQDLIDVLTYTTGVESNDETFGASFPYLAMPHSGTGECSGILVDIDGDGIDNVNDNCPLVSNPNQKDTDGDNVGNKCDNCRYTVNADQADADGDGIGDACDSCPNDPNNDIDGDGICGDVDNCPFVSNNTQGDRDDDGVGNKCDNCPLTPNADQLDSDENGIGDACDGELLSPEELNFLELMNSDADLTANINIYPNPTKGETTFNLSGFEQEALLEIFDWSGRLIFSRTISADDSQQFNLNLQALRISAGIYVIVARSGNQMVTKKLTLQ